MQQTKTQIASGSVNQIYTEKSARALASISWSWAWHTRSKSFGLGLSIIFCDYDMMFFKTNDDTDASQRPSSFSGLCFGVPQLPNGKAQTEPA